MPITPIRKLDTYIAHCPELKFGDFLLFQEYNHLKYNHNTYCVGRPKLVIYLGFFIADQTLGFNYIQWNNELRPIKITNRYVKNYKSFKQVGKVENHIEWDEFIDILGHWERRPTWKELLSAFRKGVAEERAEVSYIEYHPHLIEPPEKIKQIECEPEK